MLNSEITIRDANIDDIKALTVLMNELGYPATENEIEKRFSNLFKIEGYKTLLAVAAGGAVTGMIGMSQNYGYEHDARYIRVLALVVGKNFRNLGTGKLLMLEAEKWAAQIDAYMIVLTSGIRGERDAAYAFYQHLGYQIKSSGFVKVL